MGTHEQYDTEAHSGVSDFPGQPRVTEIRKAEEEEARRTVHTLEQLALHVEEESPEAAS